MSASEVNMFQNFANQRAPAQRARTFEEAVAAHRANAESVGAPSVVGGQSNAGPPSSVSDHHARSFGAPANRGYAGSAVSFGSANDHVQDDESVVFEKQATLLEIDRLRQGGAQPSRAWSVDDNLDDMRIEERKLKSNMEETQMVATMRDFLRLGFAGIEFMNARVRFFELDGWAETAGKDIERYDGTLRQLYRKYGRRATASPEIELLMGVGASIMMHHTQQKTRQRTVHKPPQARPPPRADESVPFSMPGGIEEISSEEEDESPPPVVGVTVG